MKRGSITVYLSLILVLLFSFILTTLEAARIRGATAYASMITELAGDSALAAYYYPLFQNYRLFGIHTGDEKGRFSKNVLAEDLEKNITSGLEETEGGLLRFQNTKVVLTEYETLLSDGETEFISQIRQQVLLDGFSLALSELFSEEQFEEAGATGEIIREQEEALDATATVTKELIRLMELVDGIRMRENGIYFDRYGNMEAKSAFIKQLIPLDESALCALYDNEEVYTVTAKHFFRADEAAEEMIEQLEEVDYWEDKIVTSENRIERYENRLEDLEDSLEEEMDKLSEQENPDETRLHELKENMEDLKESLEREEDRLDGYESKKTALLKKIKSNYKTLQNKLQAVEALLGEALEVVERLEKKQKAASITVTAYEFFLNARKEKLSEELYQVFLKELDKMKLYAGLEESGFSVKTMRNSLAGNQKLLQGLSLSGFSEKKLWQAESELEAVVDRMAGYTVDGLWFPYGEIVVAETTLENVSGALGELLTSGVLSLVGISKEEQSACELDGKDLPSDGLEGENLMGELLSCMKEVAELFRHGGMGEVLRAAGNAALDGTALELYCMKYFHCFGEESPYTKLKYEREYLIFGEEKDRSNLLSVVLYLVAVRALLSMVALLKQPDKMLQIENLAIGVAGLTGISVLGTLVKYSILLLWAVEEALVEVSALLQGKQVPVAGTGRISFEELFICGKKLIEQKANAMPDGIGADYQDYLTLLSLTKGTKKKVYRALDLIQENIRYRYNDGFRIRNVVTKVWFRTDTELAMLFDTGVFPEQAYSFHYEEEAEY